VVYGGVELKNILNDLLIFDFNTNKWICLNGESQKGVFGHSANFFEDKMFCFGGCDGKIVLKELKTFQFKEKK